MNQHLRLFVLLSLLANLAAAADGPQRAGLVTAIRGGVQLMRPGKQPRKPELKESIFEGDVVKTGRRGRVQICFEDDSIVSIGNNATLVITKYLFDPSAKKGAMEIEVKEGFFRVLGGAVTRIAPENFETVAGTASIGIRGCSFGGQVVDGVATVVFFGSNIGGDIEVTGAGVRRPIATPGDGLVVPRGGPPSMPSPMERFGVRVLDATSFLPRGGTGDGGPLPVSPLDIIDRTKTLDRDLRGLLRLLDNMILLNGFAIGEELDTGWLYRNGSANLLQLELTMDSGLLDTVADGGMLVSIHSSAPVLTRDGFLLPVLSFCFADGTISDGVDLFGDTVLAVTDSSIAPAAEPRSYMNWGEWGMTFVDPNAVGRESRTVRGLWIATDLAQTDLETLTTDAGDLVLGGDFSGTYDGFAHCIRNGTTSLDGSSHFEVNFRSQSFTGDFDFALDDGPTMSFSGRVNTDGSVQGNCTAVSDETVLSSESTIEGALYDNARVIGTSWNAKTSTNSYIGVAGATGTVSPAAAATVTGGN